MKTKYAAVMVSSGVIKPCGDVETLPLSTTFELQQSAQALGSAQQADLTVRVQINGEYYQLLLKHEEPTFPRPTKSYYHAPYSSPRTLREFSGSSWTNKTSQLYYSTGTTGVVGQKGYSWSNDSNLQEFNFESDTWASKTLSTTNITYSGSSVLNNYLYQIAGAKDKNSFPALIRVTKYAPLTDSCSTIGSVSASVGGEPTTQVAPFSSIDDNHFYCFFGSDGYGNLSSKVYDIQLQLDTLTSAFLGWQPSQRNLPASNSINRTQIVIAGGYDGSESSSLTHKFIPTYVSFYSMVQMPEKKHSSGSMVIQGSFYAVGGYQTGTSDRTTTNYKFESYVNSWSTDTALPEKGEGRATFNVL